jgi:hypothetical protein
VTATSLHIHALLENSLPKSILQVRIRLRQTRKHSVPFSSIILPLVTHTPDERARFTSPYLKTPPLNLTTPGFHLKILLFSFRKHH